METVIKIAKIVGKIWTHGWLCCKSIEELVETLEDGGVIGASLDNIDPEF